MITIEIPSDYWLSANQRLHWAAKARRTAWLRAQADAAATAALRAGTIEPMHVARCVARVSMPSRRRSDPGNAAPTVKALVDGCVQAGLLPDDDRAHLVGPDYRAGDPTHIVGLYRIIVAFESLESIMEAAA